MSKVAFCFPGQGSQRVGMGQALAQAFPESAAIYEESSERLGYDLARMCFDGPLEELSESEEHPACRWLRRRSPHCGPWSRGWAWRPTWSSVTASASTRAIAAGRLASASATSSTSSASGAWRWLESRAPRARWRPYWGCQSTLEPIYRAPAPRRRYVWARQLQTAQDSSVISGVSPASAVPNEKGEGAGREGGSAYGCRAPSTARSFSPMPPTVLEPCSAVSFPRAGDEVHEHRVEQARDRRPGAWTAGRAADRAGAVHPGHPGPVVAERPCRTFVELGSGSVLAGLVRRIDDSVTAIAILPRPTCT